MIQGFIVGRLGKDAEVKDINGKNVINFSVAVDTGFGDKKTTTWVDCAKWGEKTGVAQFLKKGKQVAISGEIGIRTWEGGATITCRVANLDLVGGGQQESQTTSPAESEPSDGGGLPF